MKKFTSSTWPPTTAEVKRALEEHMAVMDDEFTELVMRFVRPMLDDREFEAFCMEHRGRVNRGTTH
jgi:hypothetical protein